MYSMYLAIRTYTDEKYVKCTSIAIRYIYALAFTSQISLSVFMRCGLYAEYMPRVFGSYSALSQQ